MPFTSLISWMSPNGLACMMRPESTSSIPSRLFSSECEAVLMLIFPVPPVTMMTNEGC
jgi:hypothetical protein